MKAPSGAAGLTVESSGVTIEGMAFGGGKAGIEVLNESTGFVAEGQLVRAPDVIGDRGVDPATRGSSSVPGPTGPRSAKATKPLATSSPMRPTGSTSKAPRTPKYSATTSASVRWARGDLETGVRIADSATRARRSTKSAVLVPPNRHLQCVCRLQRDRDRRRDGNRPLGRRGTAARAARPGSPATTSGSAPTVQPRSANRTSRRVRRPPSPAAAGPGAGHGRRPEPTEANYIEGGIGGIFAEHVRASAHRQRFRDRFGRQVVSPKSWRSDSATRATQRPKSRNRMTSVRTRSASKASTAARIGGNSIQGGGWDRHSRSGVART